ncbi:MAG: hypothetical protein JO360_13800, partial [Acidobacteria bacterium]|nr:hypothetical protein [Acidobacteriota bacterium]
MSRNRYEDEDDDYYSGRARAGRREDDRYEGWRMDYERGADDYGRSRADAYGRGYARDDYSRPYEDRADYRGAQG